MKQKLGVLCTVSPVLQGNKVWQFSDSHKLQQRSMALGRTPATLVHLPWGLHHITPSNPAGLYPTTLCPSAPIFHWKVVPEPHAPRMRNLHLTSGLNISMPIISAWILLLALVCSLHHSLNVISSSSPAAVLWAQLPLSRAMLCHTSDVFCEATDSQFSHLGLICHHLIVLLALSCLRSHLNLPLLICCGHKCSQLSWVPSSKWF